MLELPAAETGKRPKGFSTTVQWKQRCVATSRRTGQRCGRWAIRGGTTCPMHGGNAPQVRAKAEDRLREAQEKILDLVPPAVRRLEELLSSPAQATALRAVVEVLDRAGLVVTRKTETRVDVHPQEISLDETIAGLIEQRAREIANTIDAEVVE